MQEIKLRVFERNNSWQLLATLKSTGAMLFVILFENVTVAARFSLYLIRKRPSQNFSNLAEITGSLKKRYNSIGHVDQDMSHIRNDQRVELREKFF